MEHEHKNRLIVNVYDKWGLILRSAGARMGRSVHFEDDIRSYLGQQCHRSSEDIHRIFFSESASHSNVVADFKNHLDSIN